MPSLTDGAIRQAIERATKSRQEMTLADGEGRGTGRLVPILKPMPTRVTAEWMAPQLFACCQPHSPIFIVGQRARHFGLRA